MISMAEVFLWAVTGGLSVAAFVVLTAIGVRFAWRAITEP